MKTLTRMVYMFGFVMTLALLLSGARGLPTHRNNECERNTTWYIWSELNDRQTSDTVGGKTSSTQDISDRSEQHSSRGEELTHDTTFHENADGSSFEHDEFSYSDPLGAGCHNSDGEPYKGDSTDDTSKDENGNRKKHHEEFFEKDGKCTKTVRDWEWNAKGELIKDTGWVRTEVPCVRTSLEVRWEGNLTMGNLSVVWGPETSVVPLTVKDKTYQGQFKGDWKGKLTSDACQCSGTFPVTIDVNGQEDEFETILFTVTIEKGAMGNCVCKGGSGSKTFPVQAETYKFELPAQGGATITMDGSKGAIKTKIAFTLKMK
jgi:hypothetical protein